jgi:PDZ domain-containing secreted protein
VLPDRAQMAKLVAALMISIVIVAAGNVHIGMSLVAPGMVENLGQAVKVSYSTDAEGNMSGTPTAPPARSGDIYQVSVYSWQASFADIAYALVNDDVDLVGDPTRGLPKEEQSKWWHSRSISTQNAAQMVAFKAASIPVTPTGSGAVIEDLITEPARSELSVGDVITSVAGVPVMTAEDIRQALAGKSPGDEVGVDLIRRERPTSVTVTLSPGPNKSQPVLLGVRVSTLDPKIESPYKVEFDLAGQGSSGGIALALEIYMQVTGKDLTGGRSVVATGELNPAGYVRPVGGVLQKALTASQAGADVFIVPIENLEEALDYAGEMEVIGVSSFKDAVSQLEALAGTD